MNDYPIKFEGWEGSDNIVYMTQQYVQLLQKRGATINEVILIIKSSEFFQGDFYLYNPGEKVKTTVINFKYNNSNVCVNIDAVNVRWENTIRNTVNNAIERCNAMDNPSIAF